ncbi:MAG: DEAD/DEAH box helicase [Candidatus Thermoplasmatota archaeon]|nr:DEAD/DEAH box helicase [Candidatus Thermoplasmatota archaeon]
MKKLRGIVDRKIKVRGLEGLTEEVSRHLLDKGIEEGTGPQIEAIPMILKGEDVLVVAPTGFGKTEAVFGPLLQMMLSKRGEGISLLYIAPIRALNRDILERMEKWCTGLDLTISVRHSDTTQSERARQSRKPPDVLVTTPETLQIMFTGKNLRKGLAKVRFIVIDEVHEMFGEERGAQLDVAMARLDSLCGQKVQRIGLSATVADPAEVARFLGGPLRKVQVVQGSWRKDFSFEVDSPPVEDGDKEIASRIGAKPKVVTAIKRIVSEIGNNRSTLVFVNSRDLAEALTTRIRAFDPDLDIGIHHGSLSKEARTEMESRFKEGDLKAMVCTSSMELGLDIGTIDLVVQFKSPKEISRLIQRGGRAGHRIGDVSRVLVLATDADDILEAGVISRLALKRRLESRFARREMLTVLANQILSAATADKAVGIDEFYEVLRSTYTFSSLSRERYLQVLKFLHDSALVFWNEEEHAFKGGSRSRKYFLSNISMIPDERVMLIRDLSNRRIIGSLDMDFVLSNLEPYSNFIVKGQTWRVVDIKDEEVLVEPVPDLGPVPAWSGSDIPVPWEVAREVGKIRTDIEGWLDGGKEPGSLRSLKLTSEAKEAVISQLREQKDSGFSVPTYGRVTLEYGNEGFMMGVCGGTRVNDTIGRTLAAMLMGRFGGTIIVSSDPYRIIMQGDVRIKPADMRWAIANAPAKDLKGMLPVLIKNSPLLRWEMLHVAKKMGVIAADTDPKSFPLRRMLARWRDSLIMEEALAKIMHERFDLPNAARILNDMADGRIEIVDQGISPMSMAGIAVRNEFISPGSAGMEIIGTVKDRLMTSAVKLTCMSCGSALRATAVRAREIVGCYRCGSMMLSPIPAGDLQTQKAVQAGLAKKKLGEEDTKRFKAAVMASQLFATYGYRAVMCMAARGVGPKTAGRILEIPYSSDEELVRRIFSDEIKYARNRRFWD